MRYFPKSIARKFFAALCAAWLLAPPCRADWSWNLGHQNPPGATVGLNFLYEGSKWDFETGIGWIDAKAEADDDKSTEDDQKTDEEKKEEEKKNRASISAAGDVNLKYLLASGGAIRPYIQGGFGVGVGVAAGHNSGAGAGTGAPFGGLGIFIGRRPLYVYLGAAAGTSLDPFLQGGLGFDL